MKQNNRLVWSCAPLVLGGLVWIGGGIVLALRPGGHPPESFRATMDIIPGLGVGLFLIGGSLGVQALRLPHRGERSFYIAAACCLIGAFFYPVGALVRRGFMEGVWEPLMPIGFLLVIAGCGLYGITTLATRLFPKPVAVLLILAAGSLLGFNDQYTPWMGSIFGAVITVFGCAVALRGKRSNPPSITAAP
jgi:hydrogenase/urease accessory protein HupE